MTTGSGGTSSWKWINHPTLDWAVAVIIVLVVVLRTPLADLFAAADSDGQRGAMSSVSSLLANVAAFGVAGLFAYSALENPTTRRMRARWGSHMTGVFLRSFGLVFVAACVTGVAAVSVPSRAGTIVFISASVLSAVKMVGLLLLVASLLKGQDDDARREDRPAPEVRNRGGSAGGQPGQGGRTP